jgi:hypothetical protein
MLLFPFPNLRVSFSLHSVPGQLARTTNPAKKTLEREKKMGSPDEHQPTNSGDITPRVRRGRCLLTTVWRKVMLYVGFYPNFEDYPAPNGGLAAWRDPRSTYLRWLSSQFRNSSVRPFIHPPTKEEAKVSDGDQEKARNRTNYRLPKCVWLEGLPCYWILPELHRQPARILKLVPLRWRECYDWILELATASRESSHSATYYLSPNMRCQPQEVDGNEREMLTRALVFARWPNEGQKHAATGPPFKSSRW